jgi:hypothetical protein
MADVNGDHMADIVGFASGGVQVSLATGDGHFASPVAGIQNYTVNAGEWVSQDLYPRQMADVNGDGMADIVGFAGGGVQVSLATGSGQFASPVAGIDNFALNAGGWTSQDQYPRLLGDVNGDHMADIVGFAGGRGAAGASSLHQRVASGRKPPWESARNCQSRRLAARATGECQRGLHS